MELPSAGDWFLIASDVVETFRLTLTQFEAPEPGKFKHAHTGTYFYSLAQCYGSRIKPRVVSAGVSIETNGGRSKY